MVYDWVKIKYDYVYKNIKLGDLASKYKMPYDTLRKKAKKENWSLENAENRRKSAEKTAAKIIEKTSDKLSDRAAKITDKTFEGVDLLITKIVDDYIARKEGEIDDKSLKALSLAMVILQGGYALSQKASTQEGSKDSNALANNIKTLIDIAERKKNAE